MKGKRKTICYLATLAVITVLAMGGWLTEEAKEAIGFALAVFVVGNGAEHFAGGRRVSNPPD